jgi:hypothetical protein
MKTYTIEELEKSQKSRMDYETEHRKMLCHLKETAPYKDPTDEILDQPALDPTDPDNLVQQGSPLWATAKNSSPRWKVGNLFDPTTMERQEGSGMVPPAPVDE